MYPPGVRRNTRRGFHRIIRHACGWLHKLDAWQPLRLQGAGFDWITVHRCMRLEFAAKRITCSIVQLRESSKN